jgi:Tfp pilus assembly protein PilX
MRLQQGFSLTEWLLAFLILNLLIFGGAEIQTRILQQVQNTTQRTLAVAAATDLLHRQQLSLTIETVLPDSPAGLFLPRFCLQQYKSHLELSVSWQLRGIKSDTGIVQDCGLQPARAGFQLNSYRRMP